MVELEYFAFDLSEFLCRRYPPALVELRAAIRLSTGLDAEVVRKFLGVLPDDIWIHLPSFLRIKELFLKLVEIV